MNPFTGVSLYLMIWWVVLFAVLPLGVRPNIEADDSTGWRGAPDRPRMWKKALITTLVSAVIWVGLYVRDHRAVAELPPRVPGDAAGLLIGRFTRPINEAEGRKTRVKGCRKIRRFASGTRFFLVEIKRFFFFFFFLWTGVAREGQSSRRNEDVASSCRRVTGVPSLNLPRYRPEGVCGAFFLSTKCIVICHGVSCVSTRLNE